MLTGFGRFNLIFNKMPLIFLGVLIVFTVSSFEVSTSQIALTSSLMMSGPNYSASIDWIIRFGGNAAVLTKDAREAKTSFRVSKCTLVNLVCVTGESH